MSRKEQQLLDIATNALYVIMQPKRISASRRNDRNACIGPRDIAHAKQIAKEAFDKVELALD